MPVSKAVALGQWLQRQITSGAWPVNSRIPTESEIAAQHGVGRSTVREATHSVTMLGMLEALPGCGTFVRSASPVNSVLAGYLGRHTAEGVRALRTALEAEAAALAALRRTDAQVAAIEQAAASGLGGCRRLSAFHRLVFEAAGEALLSDLYDGLFTVPAQPSAVAGRRPATDSTAEHELIAAAIRAGDADAARTAAARHAGHELAPEKRVAATGGRPLGRRLEPSG